MKLGKGSKLFKSLKSLQNGYEWFKLIKCFKILLNALKVFDRVNEFDIVRKEYSTQYRKFFSN